MKKSAEDIRLLLGVAKYILDSLTEDEAEQIYCALYNDAAEAQSIIDGLDFRGDAMADLVGGRIIAICPCDCGAGLDIIVYTPEKSLVEVDGCADFFHERIEDAGFDVTRTDVVRHGVLSAKAVDVIARELLKIIHARARALARLKGADEGVDF